MSRSLSTWRHALAYSSATFIVISAFLFEGLVYYFDHAGHPWRLDLVFPASQIAHMLAFFGFALAFFAKGRTRILFAIAGGLLLWYFWGDFEAFA